MRFLRWPFLNWPILSISYRMTHTLSAVVIQVDEIKSSMKDSNIYFPWKV